MYGRQTSAYDQGRRERGSQEFCPGSMVPEGSKCGSRRGPVRKGEGEKREREKKKKERGEGRGERRGREGKRVYVCVCVCTRAPFL